MSACSGERDLDEGSGHQGIPRRAAHMPPDHSGAGERDTSAGWDDNAERRTEGGEMEEIRREEEK